MAWWDIGSWWENLWNAVSGEIDEVVSAVEDVLNIKEIAAEELAALISELKEATKDAEDFAERVRTLEKRVIRADVIFKLINDIRTGAIRDWIEDVLGDLQNTILTGLEDVISAGQDLHVVKTSGPITLVNKFIDTIKAIYKGYAIVTAILHALHQFVPIVQEINDKLAEFESVILPQDRPKIRVDDPGYHYSRRG